MSTSGSTLKLVRQVTSADDGRISNIELDPSSTAEEANLFNLGGGAFDPGSTDTSPPRLIVTTLPIQFGDDHSMLECTLYGAADQPIVHGRTQWVHTLIIRSFFSCGSQFPSRRTLGERVEAPVRWEETPSRSAGVSPARSSSSKYAPRRLVQSGMRCLRNRPIEIR